MAIELSGVFLWNCARDTYWVLALVVLARLAWGLESLDGRAGAFLAVGVLIMMVKAAAEGATIDLPGGMRRRNNKTIESGRSKPGEGQGFTVSWVAGGMQGWRENMEDTHVALTCLDAADRALVGDASPNIMMFAVYDGHGGSKVSEACSSFLPDRISKAVRQEPDRDLGEVLKEVHIRIDEDLRKVGQDRAGQTQLRPFPLVSAMAGEPNAFGYMGCTAVTAIIVANRITVSNIGDSRVLLCRNGKCIPLSEDHKPTNPGELQRIRAAGGTVTQCGPCARVDMGLNLSRALGDFAYKDPKMAAERQKICPVPDIQAIDLEPHQDEFLIVACDGLFELFENDSLVELVKSMIGKTPLQDVLETMLEKACTPDPRATDGLGTDNETAVLIKFDWGSDRSK
mmetsp:Transcript_4614/g.10147  ORF Transcript_4614/g.10147 Transcript_4614/m.10147 type:complete len:399 (-) Transcript_4614:138-1334(-)